MDEQRTQHWQILAGVGNEVLWTLAVLVIAYIGLSGAVIYLLRWFQGRRDTIDDQSRENVELARRHLPHVSDRLLQDANGEVMASSPHFGADNQCPVCLNEPRYPVETNCGHLFCARCLILYWCHGNWRGAAVKCPVCRQQVTVLLRCFREQPDPSANDREERNQILWEINDYNRRFSGEPRPWLDYVLDLPILLRHLGSEFFSVGGLMYMFRLRIVLCFVAAIMYLISPLDMIPEAVFGILGLLDDLFVVFLLAIYVTVIYRRFLATRWQNEANN